ncbi:MAG: lasso peptide biosynthesis B2 protein [Actinomycetota bacterium]
MAARPESKIPPVASARRPAGAYRAARWAWSATRALRRDLPELGLGASVLPPPDLPAGAGVGVWAVLNRLSPTCLERALVGQSWLAAHGEPCDVIVGVRAGGGGNGRSSFAAHAWIEGSEPESEKDFVELHRLPASGGMVAGSSASDETVAASPVPGGTMAASPVPEGAVAASRPEAAAAVTAPGLPAEWAWAATALKNRAQRLKVDRWTAEVFGAFRSAAVDAVLLKGPAVARWLYAEDPDARSYVDVDALIRPAHHGRAEQVLSGLGFVVSNHPDWLLPHARCWVRAADGAKVDLHRSLHAMEMLPPVQAWEAVIAGAEQCEVAGTGVTIPGPAMRTLHAVLHAGAGEHPQALEDLRRAIAQVDLSTWREATVIARRLGVSDDMGERLRAGIGGSALADTLGLPREGALRMQVITGIERGGLPPSLFFISTLAAMSTWGGKARWLLHRQFPDRRYMEARYPLARAGRAGLAAAYGARAVQSGIRLPEMLAQWARFKRDRA